MIPRRRLYWHIFPLLLLVMVAVLVALTVYSTKALERFFLDQARKELIARGQILIPQLPRSELSGTDPALQKMIIEQGRTSGTRITVVLPGGRVRADSEHDPKTMDNHARRPEISTALEGDTGSAIRFSKTLRKRMMYVALPVRGLDGSTAAVIRTAFSVSDIDDRLAAIRLRMGLGGVVSVMLAVFLSVLASRRLSRPIEEIKRGAQRFAAGELDQPLPIPDAEELANLARTMNQMAAEIAARIHQSESRSKEIEAILASMIEGVIAVDMSEKIMRINAAASGMLSTSPDEAAGRPLHELIRNTAFQELFEQSLSTGTVCRSDIIFYTPEERIIDISCTPLRDAADKRLGTLIVMSDVTQLRRLENMRRDFAANVSHEIKTPLTAIKGFVETLRHSAVDDPEAAARFLEIIEKHVNRLAAIIEDLMQLSRIERDNAGDDLFLREHPLGGILQTALQLCAESSAERQIPIELDCPGNITVMADSPLLEQAAVNLMDNALKYSRPGQPIQVTARRHDREIRISFADHGPGIPRKHLSRLFERFYRVDKARSRQMGGTGLGLAIVKHIVQAHGGTITVDSEVNAGSTFTIHLPLPAPSGQATAL